MTRFHPLVIKDIRRETADCVSIAFDVPSHLAGQFQFSAGQNVTFKMMLNGEELRRSYSICSSPTDGELRVAVKMQPEGRFSFHANRHLQPGHTIEVLPPSGRFTKAVGSDARNHYLAFAAGSGITPVISIIRTTLFTEPDSSFTLVYGNRNRSSIIFREQLAGLKNTFMDRFVLHHILSREEMELPVYQGRIDAGKCEELSRQLIDVGAMSHIYLCGPQQMISAVRQWLREKNIPDSRVHFELFSIPGEKTANLTAQEITNAGQTCQVNIRLDGMGFGFELPFDGPSILEAALQHGADLPFACKGGVCATCRARLVSGEVIMERNYALEDTEVAAGFVLTCQSHPRSAEVTLDFDLK